MDLGFRVLGPLEVLRGSQQVDVSAGKQRVVLASLLLESGRVVSVDRLVGHLWGDSPGRNARQTVHIYVARLRNVVGDDTIATLHGGYRIAIGPGRLDLADFDVLVARADHAENQGDTATAADLLTEALSLWRGDVLDNVPSDDLHASVVPGLVERLLSTTEHRIDLALRLGRNDAIAELRTLTSQYPLRERLWESLIRALYMGGRQAEALEMYDRVAERLVRDVGVEPGAELRKLHQHILSGKTVTPSVAPKRAAPVRQLPADVARFAGRHDAIGALSSWLSSSGGQTIAVVSGPPGVGKTALAVHVGHLLPDEYADGQLYVDLHGFSAASSLTASDVLTRFLRSLGVPAEQVPLDLDEQAARYRSVLAGRRMLIVLDNAVSVDQVRPLLPGTPGCDVIVTSRSQLRGLLAFDSARALPLDVLDPAESQTLLEDELGVDRVADELDVAVELTELCARLPLALRIASANLAMDRHRKIADLVTDLSTGDRLASLWLDDDASSQLTATFELSYTALDEGTRALFRLLGMVPGTDFTRAAVAALAGGPERVKQLDVLVNASLVQACTAGRYRMHDLVRVYARGRAQVDDTTEARTAALRRLFGWYLRMVDAALVPRYPNFARLPRPAPEPQLVATADIAWLDDELPNLVAAVGAAAEDGPFEYAWQLADALRAHLSLRWRRIERKVIAPLATGAAERHGDLAACAAMHVFIATEASDDRDVETALREGRKAVELYQRAGHTLNAASALQNLAITEFIAMRPDDAVANFERAYAVFQAADHVLMLSTATNLATMVGETGRLREAVDRATHSLDLSRRRGALDNEAHALGALGILLRRVGRFDDSVRMLASACQRYVDLGDRFDEGRVRGHLVRAYCDAGRHDHARAAAIEATRLAEDLGSDEVTYHVLCARAEVDVRLGHVGSWLERLSAVAHELSGTGWHHWLLRTLDVLASAFLVRGEYVRALDTAQLMLAHCEGYSMPLVRDVALTLQTAALCGVGRYGEAVELGRLGLERHRQTGYRLREARTSCVLGDAYAGLGEATEARRLWCRAYAVYADIRTGEIADAEQRLAR